MKDGKCGICGENINSVKQFEKGGALYRGFSVRAYTRGEIIDVKVYLSANHLGWTEFRICNVDNWETDATQGTYFIIYNDQPLNNIEFIIKECLDQTLLQDLTGNTRIPIQPNVFNFHTQLQLPKNLVCDHCVFQVRLHQKKKYL